MFLLVPYGLQSMKFWLCSSDCKNVIILQALANLAFEICQCIFQIRIDSRYPGWIFTAELCSFIQLIAKKLQDNNMQTNGCFCNLDCSDLCGDSQGWTQFVQNLGKLFIIIYTLLKISFPVFRYNYATHFVCKDFY